MHSISPIADKRHTAFYFSEIASDLLQKNVSQGFMTVNDNVSTAMEMDSSTNGNSDHSFVGGHLLLLFATAVMIPFFVRRFLHFMNVIWPNILFWCISHSFFCREFLVVEEPLSFCTLSEKIEGNVIWNNSALIDAIMHYSTYCLEAKKKENGRELNEHRKLAEGKGSSTRKTHPQNTLSKKWFPFWISNFFHLYNSSVVSKNVILQGQFIYTSRRENESSLSSLLCSPISTFTSRSCDVAKILREEYHLQVVPAEDHIIEVEPGIWIRFEGMKSTYEKHGLHSGKPQRSGAEDSRGRHRNSSRKWKSKHRHHSYPGERDEPYSSFWVRDFYSAIANTQEHQDAKYLSSKNYGFKGKWKSMKRQVTMRASSFSSWKTLGPFPLKYRRKKKRGIDAPPKWFYSLNTSSQGGITTAEEQNLEGSSSSSSSDSDISIEDDIEESEDSDNKNSSSSHHKIVSEEHPFVPYRRVWLYYCDPLFWITSRKGKKENNNDDFLYSEWDTKERKDYYKRRRWLCDFIKEERKDEEMNRDEMEKKPKAATHRGQKYGVIEAAILKEEEENRDFAGQEGTPHDTCGEEKKTEKWNQDKKLNNDLWRSLSSWSKYDNTHSRNSASSDIMLPSENLFFPFSQKITPSRKRESQSKTGRLDYFIYRAYLWYHFQQLPFSIESETDEADEKDSDDDNYTTGVEQVLNERLDNTEREKEKGKYINKETPHDSTSKRGCNEMNSCTRIMKQRVNHLTSPSFNFARFSSSLLSSKKKRFFIFPYESEFQKRLRDAEQHNHGANPKSKNSFPHSDSDAILKDGYSDENEEGHWGSRGYRAPILSVRRYEMLDSVRVFPSCSRGRMSKRKSTSRGSSSTCKMKWRKEDGNEEEADSPGEDTGEKWVSAALGSTQDVDDKESSKKEELHDERTKDIAVLMDAEESKAGGVFFPLLTHPRENISFSPYTVEQETGKTLRRKHYKSVDISGSDNIHDRIRNHKTEDKGSVLDGVFFPQRSDLEKLLNDFKERKGVYAKPGYPHRIYLLVSAGRGMMKGGVSSSSSSAIPATTSCAFTENGFTEEIITQRFPRNSPGHLEEENPSNSISKNDNIEIEVETATVDIVKAVASYLQRSVVILSLKSVITNDYVNTWLNPIRLRCEGEKKYELSDSYERDFTNSDESDNVSMKLVDNITSLHPTEVVYWLRDIDDVNNFAQAMEYSDCTQNCDAEEEATEVTIKEKGKEPQDLQNEKEEETSQEEEISSPTNLTDKALKRPLLDVVFQASCQAINCNDRLSLDGLMRTLAPSIGSTSGRVVILSSNKEVGEAPGSLSPRWIHTPLLLNLHIPISGYITADDTVQMIRYYHFSPTQKEVETIRTLFPCSQLQKNREGTTRFTTEVSKKEMSKKVLIPSSVLRDYCCECHSVKDILHHVSSKMFDEHF